MSCHLIETANAAAKAVAPGAVLPDPARAALLAALADETLAADLCAARVAALGEVGPFAKHLKAKRRRKAALATMAKAYGLALPKTPAGADEAAPPVTLEAALAEGAAAETARLARYDAELIPAAASAPELAAVLHALAVRTRDRHLPALRRALAAARGVPDLHGSGHRPGQGRGQGRGQGHGHGAGQGQCHGHGHHHAHGAHHDHGHGGCGGGRCGHGHAHQH